MIPGIGTLLNLVSKTVQLPVKALGKAAGRFGKIPAQLRESVSNLQESADAKIEGGIGDLLDTNGAISTLKDMAGGGRGVKENARSLWQTINRSFIKPLTKPLPNFKFVNTQNLIQKPFQERMRQKAKERLEQKKSSRPVRERRPEDTQHYDLKEKWKNERKNRNSNLVFNLSENSNLNEQHVAENRYLQDYYRTLLDKEVSENDKLEAALRYEREKLDIKYNQLQILQDSLNSIQANFGKLAVFTDNSFDTVQEQIAVSADLSDKKQSLYNENLASDIEYLQTNNDNNAEVIVDAITESQDMQEATLEQLNQLEENNQGRNERLGEALETIEQQQYERHVQQMYVLDNIGTEIVSAAQRQEEQHTEQQYVYSKFAKNQKKNDFSLPRLIVGGILGVLTTFFRALADPQQVVSTLADTAGSFVAEVLSTIQLLVGNGVYGIANIYTSLYSPLQQLLHKFLGTYGDNIMKLFPGREFIQTSLQAAKWLPNQFSGLGMPDMIILPEPKLADIPKEQRNEALEFAFWKFSQDPVHFIDYIFDKNIAKLQDKITASLQEVFPKSLHPYIDTAMNVIKKAVDVTTFVPKLSYKIPVGMAKFAYEGNKAIITGAADVANYMFSKNAKPETLAGRAFAYNFSGQAGEDLYNLSEKSKSFVSQGYSDIKEGMRNTKAAVASLLPPQAPPALETTALASSTSGGRNIVEPPQTDMNSNQQSLADNENPFINIDNSTTNIYPTITNQLEKQFAAGV